MQLALPLFIVCNIYIYTCRGPGSSVGIATGYGLDDPGIESRWGGEIFSTCPDRPWGPPSLLYDGYWVFPGGIERPGRDADTSPPLVPWSRKSKAIPLLSLWTVWPIQSLSACTRMHFTFTFYVYLSSNFYVIWYASLSVCVQCVCVYIYI